MSTWFEIQINKSGTNLLVGARGSGDREVAPRPLGGGFDLAAIHRFSDAVHQAANHERPLPDDIREMAVALGRAILDGDIETMRLRLAEASKGALLLRLNVGDPELQRVPWEAVCIPGQSFGFWATSSELFPVRRVTTPDAWQPREIRSGLRVLAIAPTDTSSLPNLQDAVCARMNSGEVEWLDPIVGIAARGKYLFERLRRKPTPHILHFLGHGRISGNIPELRVGNEDEGERWIPVELFAQEIRSHFQGDLRAVILEACDGAAPSAFASAAELFGRAGADAVVAHLWPVRADIARAYSEHLYRALTEPERLMGDISRAVNEARRSLFVAYDNTAQTFSPVIYLRGPNGEIFDFKVRKLVPMASPPVASAKPIQDDRPVLHSPAIPAALTRIFKTSYSLVLGDLGTAEHDAFMKLRDKLLKDLAKESQHVSKDAPLSTVAQLYSFLCGPEKLGNEFQKVLRVKSISVPPIIPAIAAQIGPGVHITLLRNPWLEEALAEKQPHRTIYVIQPGDQGVRTYMRQAEGDWEECPRGITSFDPESDIVLLRLFRGYTPENLFARPLLTEDDYLHELGDLESLLPRDLANAIASTLNHRPALFLGVSMHAWHHRMLLHRMFPRGIPRDSVAIVNSAGLEEMVWQSGAGLPGKAEGTDVVELSMEALDAMMRAGVES